MSQVEVEIQGKRLKLSDLEKVLYPVSGFTKAQMIDYYTRASPVLLPHLKNRPLTLKRYPEGVDREFFYEKQCPSYRPAWVRTAPIWSEGNARDINYCLINDLPSLVWTANLADIELHTSLSLSKDIARPTVLAFDLDPGAPADILDCAQVAWWIYETLDGLKLKSFAKTSGSKGLQVYVPLNTPISYSETKPFAHRLAGLLEEKYPGHIVSNMKKNLRKGKVFIDWSQNDAHKTTVCVYSLRARARPTVSTPVTWDEIKASLEKKEPLDFDYRRVLKRIEKFGDLFAPVLKLKQRLPKLSKLNPLPAHASETRI